MSRNDQFRKECTKCGTSYDGLKNRKCPGCAKTERLKDVKCPCCKSENVQEHSISKNNGVMGPGYSSWSILDFLVCHDCGVMFQNLKELKKQK